MKFSVITAIAAATVAVASPVAVEHEARQGPTFPSTCTSVCNMFFPVYNSCKDIPTKPAFLTCLQPICSEAAWPKLGPCLTCWSAATGGSTIPWWSLFSQACT
ncbi:hypothetical protein CcaverHIS002_0312440 [Cutaneotrichosporon cavernicola]|uniref:Extracellular membrane protein CFEM domain-containing protein n=1 Tax=Cutaneotrichosporon cavernicola TaxID=279322 RepID=A0AA48L3A3_9TREE|nr:uncharacterized protein CcaverHIS019_0312310 [Cutaneotrichosporon cavernicola]BEI83376.1 hypothetical protein CcaverHIS002_0312440 [Cutaneotrichosporon cavernicola]BEI91161.1 hypothetical protein CcaverHIS019_0312310 [Cutaneotrichosporon cavernicola]BEI98938.1 hypothetical protein CcaverHIS631_0312370 [Cutaneotrichosporon cavernicola]BEJ06712.1 hypothetical protein CcaverHIS641_0312340 [Cutaneotrichosporon cavernicola]